MSKISGLVTPKGVPVTPDGKPIKAPPPDALAWLLQAQYICLMVEEAAFRDTKGTLLERFRAARDSTAVMEKVLTEKEARQGHVVFGPGIQGRVSIAGPPGKPSRVHVTCKTIREGLAHLRRNGYAGIPLMGIDPADVVKALEYEEKERRRQ